MNKIFTVIIIGLLFFCGSIYGQNTLKYNFKIGDSLIVSQKSNQAIVQDMNGQKHEMNNVIEGDYVFYIKAKTDSSYIIDFKYNTFKMTSTSNIYGSLMSVDTTKEVLDTDMEGKIFSGLTEVYVEMEMLETGKIRKVIGTEKLIERMITNAGIEDEFTIELVKEAMKKEFGNESLGESISQMTFIYPNAEVNIGDHWTTHFNGDLKAINDWTFNNVSDQIEISALSDITLNNAEQSLTMNLTGTQETSIKANLKSGFPEYVVTNSVAKGDTIMEHMKDVKIPTTITTKTIFKLERHVQ